MRHRWANPLACRVPVLETPPHCEKAIRSKETGQKRLENSMSSDKTVAKARHAVRLLRTHPTPAAHTRTRAAPHWSTPCASTRGGSTPYGITPVRPPGVHLAQSGRWLLPATRLAVRMFFRRDRAPHMPHPPSPGSPTVPHPKHARTHLRRPVGWRTCPAGLIIVGAPFLLKIAYFLPLSPIYHSRTMSSKWSLDFAYLHAGLAPPPYAYPAPRPQNTSSGGPWRLSSLTSGN